MDVWDQCMKDKAHANTPDTGLSHKSVIFTCKMGGTYQSYFHLPITRCITHTMLVLQSLFLSNAMSDCYHAITKAKVPLSD